MEEISFAAAITSRQLWRLPPLLPESDAEEVLLSLASSIRATLPREALLLRSLRRALAVAVRDNDDAMPRVASALHLLLTALPADSIAAGAAAGMLLLFSHGLGHLPPPGCPRGGGGPLVVMLGFAGGTPADLRKYSDRLYTPRGAELVSLCASEIPEVYTQLIAAVLTRARTAAHWVIHLFSKAGFLLLARLLRELERQRTTAQRGVAPPPAAIIWDSSPGSFSDYSEFVKGTWQSAELLARRARFSYSPAARERMDTLLRSSDYAASVRESYGAIGQLSIQPYPGGCHGLSLPTCMPHNCHHLFLFSEKDPVCNPDEIRSYLNSLAVASDMECKGVRSCKSVMVKGTHCDGLFWSTSEYRAAVYELLDCCSTG
ncbi:hypothetical protein AB1Y20_003356 [Prymnesium parvum]|uniref:Uncharacterized protein n=1 Tax=Prymnesium parvum TaxID=97485 RepID=A0AB34JBC3_PRYPA